jgi:hypothetical protein
MDRASRRIVKALIKVGIEGAVLRVESAKTEGEILTYVCAYDEMIKTVGKLISKRDKARYAARVEQAYSRVSPW